MAEDCGTSRGCSTLTTFAIGIGVGALLALLYAPCSGRESRERLVRRARDLTDQAGGMVDGAKEKIHEKKSEILAAFEAGKEAMREEKDRILAALEAGKEAMKEEFKKPRGSGENSGDMG
jgi:gas vesicle protein